MAVENRQIYYYRCPNCEWRILNNQIREMTGYEDKIHFCERCGSKLDKINLNNSNNIEENNSETNLNSIEYPVEIIAKDPDFQIGFIDNLTLVLSRMIYFNIRYLEKTLDKKFENIELDLQLLNLLSGALMPILHNDIEEQFLDRLIEITMADFYSNLTKIHNKAKSYPIFRQRFIIYLRWLVKQVFVLVSELWNEGSIDKFEAIIFRDLNTYDFSKIQSKLNRKVIENNETENEDNYKVKIAPNNLSKEEIEFLEDHNIDIKDLSSRWAWVDLHPELVYNFYKEVLIKKYNRVPTSRELKDAGYSHFVEKVRKKGLSLSELAKKCGFTPRRTYHRRITSDDITPEEFQFLQKYKINFNELTSRWSWMDKNPSLAIPFFKDVIFPQFGFIPTWNELAKTNYYNFLQKLSKLNLTYPDVIKKANFEPKYQFLSDPQKVRIYKMTDTLVNEYLETGKNSNPPSLLKLSKTSKLNISDVTFGKYAKEYLTELYGSNYGKQLYSEMWVNKTLGISENLKDSIYEYVEECSQKFLQSNKLEFPISIKDIVEYHIPNISLHSFTKYAKKYLTDKYGIDRGNKIYSEMWPSDKLAIDVGYRLHVLINDLLTLYFNQKHIKYISEPYIYPRSRPDGILILSNDLRLLLNKNKNLLEQINFKFEKFNKVKAIVLDFTSDISDLNCIRKISKYRNPEILLFIVGTLWYLKKPYKTIHNSEKNTKNVRIIDIEFFSKLVELSDKFKENLDRLLKLGSNYNIEELNKIENLEKRKLHNTESLRRLLINEGFIKEEINEFLHLGLEYHPNKTFLTEEEHLLIKNEILLRNKIAIIDIETTGFNREIDSIIEIGIVELDIDTGIIKILFNSEVKDSNFNETLHRNNNFLRKSGIDINEIEQAILLQDCEEVLQLILQKYRCAAYNKTFDFGWLESRGYKIPMKLKDIMRFCQKNIQTCSYKFQDIYNFVYNNSKKSYLSRSKYKSSHRAIDDAICEAELLFYLLKELRFPLSYQSQIFTIGD